MSNILKSLFRYITVKFFQKPYSAIFLRKTSRRNIKNLIELLLKYEDCNHVTVFTRNYNDKLNIIYFNILQKYSLFDEIYYADTYLDGSREVNSIEHYIKCGRFNEVMPNKYFDPAEYLTAYPDVALAGINPVIHYALFGWREGRAAGSFFDGTYYLQANPDVASAGLSPLCHFLEFGQFEGRKPLPDVPRIENTKTNSGTILIVSHDAEIGGAQQIVKVFSEWLIRSTYYDVKLVTMRGGAWAQQFSDIADTFDISAHPEAEIEDRLKVFAGENVKVILMNSAASGSFLNYWNIESPIVCYIHELSNILNTLTESVELIKTRAHLYIGGSKTVSKNLRTEFGFDAQRIRTVNGFIEDTLNTEEEITFEEKETAKERLDFDPDAFVVAACGVVHWRKSPDKFIEVAEKVFKKIDTPVHFVWVGHGPDLDLIRKEIKNKGLDRKIQFVGYHADFKQYLDAADLFILPSEEDPFPLVCLYAARSLNPIVCFEDAGGMPEFVNRGGGRAVPFGDINAMAAAVVEYARDKTIRERDGVFGRALTLKEYTISTAGPNIMHHLRKAANINPYLSVIVPNYNYEEFLEERLSSIAHQSFQDFEVILLDDKSTDGSIALLEDFARKRCGTRLIASTKNSGSPFVQWMRGMQQAQSDLMWIAEADDTCHPDLLKFLLPYFDDRNVFLGYVKSVPIGEDGLKLGDYEEIYLNRIADGRWSQSHVVTDYEEVNQGLGIANSIPNASSVMFRRFNPEPEFRQQIAMMRMCGDWLFYLRAMRGGFVAYEAMPYNYHRRHNKTITHRTEGSRRYFDEWSEIRAYVACNYRLSSLAKARIKKFTNQDLDRFKVTGLSERKQILANISLDHDLGRLPAILIVASDLSPGGGQLFAIRLANSWINRGGRAILLNTRYFADHAKVVSKLDPRAALFHVGEAGAVLTELVERFDINVIHSSIWWADRYVQDHIGGLPNIPWIITLHGCYETLLDDPEIDRSFSKRIPAMLNRVNAWVHTADKNQRVFDIYGTPKYEMRIANGIEVEPVMQTLTRKELGLRPSATVLCLASRAIKTKGWFEAVAATKALNRAGYIVDLMLIGEGPAADELRARAPEYIRFFGQVDNLQDYIEVADIGLLPTYFAGESMPLVLMEFIAKGKPIISTNIGEIPAMIGSDDEACGILIPITKNNVDLTNLISAIKVLLDAGHREALGKKAKIRFKSHFTAQRMSLEYEKLYKKLLTCD